MLVNVASVNEVCIGSWLWLWLTKYVIKCILLRLIQESSLPITASFLKILCFWFRIWFNQFLLFACRTLVTINIRMSAKNLLLILLLSINSFCGLLLGRYLKITYISVLIALIFKIDSFWHSKCFNPDLSIYCWYFDIIIRSNIHPYLKFLASW